MDAFAFSANPRNAPMDLFTGDFGRRRVVQRRLQILLLRPPLHGAHLLIRLPLVLDQDAPGASLRRAPART